jgi:GNAT superfamily N-acetyltransferase
MILLDHEQRRECAARFAPQAYLGEAELRLLDLRSIAELRELYLSLDMPSRILRLGTVADDSRLLEHVQNVAEKANRVIGCFSQRKLVGVGELYDCRDQSICEVAFVVTANWRRKGVGWSLLHGLIGLAMQRNRSILRMIFSAQNVPMKKLALRGRATLNLNQNEIQADVLMKN